MTQEPKLSQLYKSFNTASGRYYCNCLPQKPNVGGSAFLVSIPQAVGTIAITIEGVEYSTIAMVSIPQAVGTIAI